MVLLSPQKLSNKLENHTHHHDHNHDQFSSSLQAFKSIVSNSISQLPQSRILSLQWIHNFLKLLPSFNISFSKFLIDLNHPITSWDTNSVQYFLGYTSNLLDLLNSISSCVSQITQVRMSLCHGLHLLENSPSSAIRHLKLIPPCSFNLSFENMKGEDQESRDFSGKEMSFYEGVDELKRIGFWVCGILLCGLCNDWKPYLEMRKIVGGFDDDSSVSMLDSRISELMLVREIPVLEEIEEINSSVAKLLEVSDDKRIDVSMELQKQLHVLERLIDDVNKEVDDLFGNVMNQRNELIDCFRITTHPK